MYLEDYLFQVKIGDKFYHIKALKNLIEKGEIEIFQIADLYIGLTKWAEGYINEYGVLRVEGQTLKIFNKNLLLDPGETKLSFKHCVIE